MKDEENAARWVIAAPTDVQMNNRALALFVRFKYPAWQRIIKRATFELYADTREQDMQ
jgi:hypothetical protein